MLKPSAKWMTALCSLWACSGILAAEPTAVTADAVINRQDNWIQQVSCDPCAPGGGHACDGSCGSGCGLGGCGLGGCGSGCSLFGGGGEMGDPWTIGSLLGDDCDLDIGGWIQAGYHNRSNGLFNSHPHQLNLHQAWFYVGKEADGSEGLDFGFRFDGLYGVDGPNTQSFGNPRPTYDLSDSFQHGIYGWAIPQLYGEVAYGDLSIIAGHFYTLLGYELVQATGNFFYSHSFTHNLSEAFTHTGALATYSVSDDVTLYGGWTLGWDTGFAQYDLNGNNGNSFLGGASLGLLDNLSLTYILTAGDLGWIGDGYTHSIVADWAITDKLNYVFQSDFVKVNEDVLGTGDEGYDTIGINQYLIYWMTDHLGIGGRAEWWKANGVSYYETTAGINIKPCANFVVRPEVRYQWSPAGTAAGVLTNPAGLPVDEGTIFGVDCILTF